MSAVISACILIAVANVTLGSFTLATSIRDRDLSAAFIAAGWFVSAALALTLAVSQ
jgi:hypothetical protein